jgi:hypothetical protein
MGEQDGASCPPSSTLHPGRRHGLSPTLSDIAQDPAQIAKATPETMVGLYDALEGLRSEIIARLPSLAGLPSAIASKVRPNTITGCWEWIGARDSRGYGNVKIDGRVMKAHRAVCEVVRGPILPGLECDHLCRVPWCVNPAHLEVVPHAENVRRGAARWVPGARQRTKRRCPRGHSYTRTNTYVHPRTGGRWCRQCNRERKRKTAHAPTLDSGHLDVGR